MELMLLLLAVGEPRTASQGVEVRTCVTSSSECCLLYALDDPWGTLSYVHMYIKSKTVAIRCLWDVMQAIRRPDVKTATEERSGTSV